MTYNTATADPFGGIFTARSGVNTVLSAIGNEVVGGIAKPIDVLLLQEQFSTQVSTQSIVDILNSEYGAGVYARSSINGQNTGPMGSGGAPALVYNTQTVQLIDEIQFGPIGGGEFEQPRATLRYQLRPVGYDSTADFFAYNSHYKADTGTTNNNRRLAEAQSIRNNVDILGEGTHAIYAGDYNITSQFASSYEHLLSSGPGQALDPVFDPATQTGAWRDNPAYKLLHTQSPSSTADSIAGLAGGGMDDRFDFQLVTGEFLDDEGLSYIPGSYHAFGNNGTHTCSGTSGNPCVDSINTGTGASPAVLNALMTASDHLPVVADYQLPAVMDVTFASIPNNVSQGAVVPIDVMIENVANVLASFGADELDYTVSVTGALSGGASGVDAALGGGVAHQVFLNTSTQGGKVGAIQVTSSSQGAANASVTFPVVFTVGTGSEPTFGVIANDDFDASQGRLSFTQDPPAGAYSASDDGFQIYQVGVSSAIPPQLIDTSTSGSPSDTRGVVNAASKSDAWFGVTDTVNGDNLPAGNPGIATATWVFDVAEAVGLEVSIDMAAMGEFEAGTSTPDFFDWTYSIDGAAMQPLFTSSVDDGGSATYTMADGDMFTVSDPLRMTFDDQTVQLSNIMQTLTASVGEVGNELTIQLLASTNGGDEAYAFDNIVIKGFTGGGLTADLDDDDDVDGNDFLAIQRTDVGLIADWESQFGSGVEPPTVVAVPEPASVTLVFTALAMGAWRRKR